MSKSKDKIKEISQHVLERIQAEGISPTPEAYEVLYLYFAKSNADITRAIDMIIAKNLPLTDDVCFSLYQEFLANDKERLNVKKAGTEIQNTIKDVTTMVDSVKVATHKYNDNLVTASSKLSADVDKDTLGQVLNDIKSNTSQMVTHNLMLEKKLQESVHVMSKLQNDLEIVRKESLTDALTGLSNRKAFDKKIKTLRDQMDNGDIESFALILMDIDHFKMFNDKFGHQIGDQVLKLVSKTMFNRLKGQDFAARYGGEEFAVLLPDTSLENAERVAQNLCDVVAKKNVVNRSTGEKIASITISGGVAEYLPGESKEDFIDRADEGLYEAKNQGRNRICIVKKPAQKNIASV